MGPDRHRSGQAGESLWDVRHCGGTIPNLTEDRVIAVGAEFAADLNASHRAGRISSQYTCRSPKRPGDAERRSPPQDETRGQDRQLRPGRNYCRGGPDRGAGFQQKWRGRRWMFLPVEPLPADHPYRKHPNLDSDPAPGCQHGGSAGKNAASKWPKSSRAICSPAKYATQSICLISTRKRMSRSNLIRCLLG